MLSGLIILQQFHLQVMMKYFFTLLLALRILSDVVKNSFSSIRRQDCEGCYDPIPVNPCDGYLEIEQSYDDMLELLTLTSTIDPACTTPMDTGLMWSYDGVAYEKVIQIQSM